MDHAFERMKGKMITCSIVLFNLYKGKSKGNSQLVPDYTVAPHALLKKEHLMFLTHLNLKSFQSGRR